MIVQKGKEGEATLHAVLVDLASVCSSLRVVQECLFTTPILGEAKRADWNAGTSFILEALTEHLEVICTAIDLRCIAEAEHDKRVS